MAGAEWSPVLRRVYRLFFAFLPFMCWEGTRKLFHRLAERKREYVCVCAYVVNLTSYAGNLRTRKTGKIKHNTPRSKKDASEQEANQN